MMSLAAEASRRLRTFRSKIGYRGNRRERFLNAILIALSVDEEFCQKEVQWSK